MLEMTKTFCVDDDDVQKICFVLIPDPTIC